jgi:hypothetical protein
MKAVAQGKGALQGTWQCRTGLEETVWGPPWVDGLTGARLRFRLGEADFLLPRREPMAPKDHANSCPAR